MNSSLINKFFFLPFTPLNPSQVEGTPWKKPSPSELKYIPRTSSSPSRANTPNRLENKWHSEPNNGRGMGGGGGAVGRGGSVGGGMGNTGYVPQPVGGGGEGDWFSYLETGFSTLASATYDAANVTYDAALATGLFLFVFVCVVVVVFVGVG